MRGIITRIVKFPFTSSPIVYSVFLMGIATLIVTLNVFHFSYDDAYITFRYSYNFATGTGLVYHPGETVLSTTAPVYALILGILALPFPAKIPVIAGWLSGIGLFAGALAIYTFAHRRNQDLVGILSSLSYIFFPLLMDMFGGEVIPLTALILWAFISYDAKKYILTGVLLGLATGFRIDAIFPFCLLSMHYLLQEIKIPWKLALGFGLISGIWVTYSVLRYDALLPISLSVKLAQTHSRIGMPFAQGAIQLIQSFIGSSLFYGPSALPVFRIYLFLMPLGIFAFFFKSRYWFLLLISEFIQIFGYIFLGAPFYHWYFMPILVITAILVGTGLGAIPEFLRPISDRLSKFPKRLLFFTIALVILGLVLPPVITGAGMAFRGKLAVQQSYPVKPYREIGEWIASNTSKESTVGYIEIGVIGYYSQRTMLDPVGLVTPSAIEHVQEDDLAWAYREYLPDYLVVNDRFSSILGPYQQEPWFENCYREVHSVDDIQIFQRCDEVEEKDRVVLEKVQPFNDQPVGEILPQRTVGQTFIAKQDHLRAISILLATYGREVEGSLIFHLQEVAAEFRSPDLVVIEVDISEIEDNMWRVFSFPEIEDSAGRDYYFYLEAPQSESGESITAWSKADDSYPGGTLFIDHIPESGDLSFNLYYVRP